MLHRFRLTPFALALSLLAGPLQAAEFATGAFLQFGEGLWFEVG